MLKHAQFVLIHKARRLVWFVSSGNQATMMVPIEIEKYIYNYLYVYKDLLATVLALLTVSQVAVGKVNHTPQVSHKAMVNIIALDSPLVR